MKSMPFFDRLRLIYFSYFDEILGGKKAQQIPVVLLWGLLIYIIFINWKMLLILLSFWVWEIKISTLIQETEVHSKHWQVVKPSWWDNGMKRDPHSLSLELFCLIHNTKSDLVHRCGEWQETPVKRLWRKNPGHRQNQVFYRQLKDNWR